MKKEYVVSEISAAPDGSPYVLLTLKDPKDMAGPQRLSSPQLGVVTSIDDLAKSVGRMFSQMMGGFVTVIKLSLNEYEELNVKVGDRIVVEINKSEIVNV